MMISHCHGAPARKIGDKYYCQECGQECEPVQDDTVGSPA